MSDIFLISFYWARLRVSDIILISLYRARPLGVRYISYFFLLSTPSGVRYSSCFFISSTPSVVRYISCFFISSTPFGCQIYFLFLYHARSLHAYYNFFFRFTFLNKWNKVWKFSLNFSRKVYKLSEIFIFQRKCVTVVIFRVNN